MSTLDWFARHRFVQPIGQCGNAVFYLAEDKTNNAFVVVRQYILHSNNPDEAERQAGTFEDEVRLYSLLHSKGLIRTFESESIEGKLFMVFDPQSVCELVCSHLKPENIDKAISEASKGK